MRRLIGPDSAAATATAFVRAARNIRRDLLDRGYRLVPPPTAAELKALSLWIIEKAEVNLRVDGGVGLGIDIGAAAGGAGTGAAVGTAVAPGIGTVVGAALGAVAGGVFGGGKADDTVLKAARKQKQAAQASAKGQVQAAKLALEAEKVKASASTQWLKPAIYGGAALLVLGGGLALYLIKRKRATA